MTNKQMKNVFNLHSNETRVFFKKIQIIQNLIPKVSPHPCLGERKVLPRRCSEMGVLVTVMEA